MAPIEEERLQLLEKINARNSELDGYAGAIGNAEQMFVDECEILDWDYSAPELKKTGQDGDKYVKESSHKQVEMAGDKKTPLRIRDGNFGMFGFLSFLFIILAEDLRLTFLSSSALPFSIY